MTNRGGAEEEEEDETENNRMEGRTVINLSAFRPKMRRRQTDGAFFVSGGSTDLPHRTAHYYLRLGTL